MNIPIAKPLIGKDEIQAVEQILFWGALAHGKKVEEFEEAFAGYIGTKYAIAVSSGTAALHLALLGHGIEAGSEVITTPFTFVATANSILMAGAKPVFVDIDMDTFNLDPKKIRERITSQTRAIMPVHLYGQPCAMDEIIDIANEYNLIVIEDACQAHGAEYNGQKVGSFGAGCFSFYPTKNMTTGEGGIITTNDPELANQARMLRNHGQRERYQHVMLGFNLRMTNIAAAIGLCQLKKLDQFNAQRKTNAEQLSQALQPLKGIVPPRILPNVAHVFHQYTIRVTEEYGISRDVLQQKLHARGIGAEVYYPLPLHQQPFYRQLGFNEYLPNAEKASMEVLSLPVHPGIGNIDLMKIIAALIEN